MTMNEAMAVHGPGWLQIWLPILMAGGFIAPLVLLIWPQSRKAGAIAFVASVIAAIMIGVMYEYMGYVKLLGLPHVIFWVPLVIYLLGQTRKPDLPAWPRRIMLFAIAVIVVSLAFDITDVIRYLLGERTPLAMPAAA